MKTHLLKSLMSIFVCAIFMLTAFTATAQVTPASNIIYVKTGASGNGSSWSNPADLAIALQWAQANKDNNLWNNANPLQIYVAKGIYKPSIDPRTNTVPAINQERNATLLLVRNVQLYGGFDPDNGIDDLTDTRIYGTEGTVLSGNIGDTNDVADNAYHVVMSVGDAGTAELNGFTITGGNASSTSSITVNGLIILSNNGGGMYIHSNSSPSINNVTISGNTASNGGGIYTYTNSFATLTNVTISGNTANSGGGMYNRNSSATLTNVTISENTASSDGGGMYNRNSSATLTNVTISENTANNYGGGMHNQSSSPTLTNVSLSGNIANTNGGGIHNNASSPTLTNVSLSGNTANTNGGGMYSVSSSPTLTRVTINGNTASRGGGIYNYTSPAIITNVSLRGNTATISGGGIYNEFSSPTITNVSLSGNIANRGGGVYNLTSSPSLTNVTISGNTATNGGGMFNSNGTAPAPTLVNSIVWGNGAGTSIDGDVINAFSKNNLIEGGTTSNINNILLGLTVADIFVNPQSPGLSTAGDYSLKINSIAFNAGDNSLYAGLDASTVDLAGNPRVYKFNSGGMIDLGAYEYQADPPTLPVTLLSFTAKAQENHTKLTWQTASEQNNKGFVVYRSGDDGTFVKIGEVAPAQSHIYTCNDSNPLNGNNYYRLVQVDNDGKTTELGVRTVSFELSTLGIQLYPNPTADKVTVTFPEGHYQSMEVVDLNGRILHHIAVNTNESQKELSLGSYPKGNYLITLKTKGHTYILKAIRK